MILDCCRPKLTQRTAYSSIPKKPKQSTFWTARVVRLLAVP
jgi:hypothetical protein